MNFGRITISIDVDESKLTLEQQELADKSNVDIFLDHPCEQGIESIRDRLSGGILQSMFNYLGEGHEAVTVTVSD